MRKSPLGVQSVRRTTGHVEGGGACRPGDVLAERGAGTEQGTADRAVGRRRTWGVTAAGVPASRSTLCVFEHFHGKRFIFRRSAVTPETEPTPKPPPGPAGPLGLSGTRSFEFGHTCGPRATHVRKVPSFCLFSQGLCCCPMSPSALHRRLALGRGCAQVAVSHFGVCGGVATSHRARMLGQRPACLVPSLSDSRT